MTQTNPIKPGALSHRVVVTLAGSIGLALLATMTIGQVSSTPIPLPRPRPNMIEWSYITPTVVRSIPIVKADEAVVARHEPPDIYPEPPQRAAARPRRAAINATDICARHRLRKVHYGKRWRCQR